MTPQSGNTQAWLRHHFGDIDIHVFDALLQGHWTPPMRFLDAGCGTGRNLPFFLRQGFSVYAMDGDEDALEMAREAAEAAMPGFPEENMRVATLEDSPFPEEAFDAVLCNAVLHFARDHGQFAAMLQGLWRMLAPEGTLLMRLGCRIGLEDQVESLGQGVFRQPDGATWYLPDAGELQAWETTLGARRWKPLKATLVEKRRCMATWWLRKPA